MSDKPKLKQRLKGLPVIGTAITVQDRYKDDDADQHAAAIGFFGFLSLFPLLLLALAAAGFALADDPQRQADFADALIDAIPGFAGAFGEGDSAVQDAIRGLSDNAGSVGLVGLVSLLLTGLKVVNSANRATLAVFHVDVEAPGLLVRVRQLGVLAGLGLLAVAGVAATALVGAAATLATDEVASVANGLGAGDGRVVDGALQLVATVGGLAASVLFDFLLFLAAYKLLSFGRGPRAATLWPGALLAALGWTGLKAFGATYVSGQIAKTNASVGALGGVVGLMLLLYLAGRVYVYGAEFAAVTRQPGADLAERYPSVDYEGEDPDVFTLARSAERAGRSVVAATSSTGLRSEPTRLPLAIPRASSAPAPTDPPSLGSVLGVVAAGLVALRLLAGRE